MATILYKWLMLLTWFSFGSSAHPIFVSVTEIGHNASNKSLEISCKIFTDDLETALRKKNTVRIDLLDVKLKAAMGPIVNDYVQKHLSVMADGKKADLQFLGFEQQEEGIISYFEARNIPVVKKIDVTDNILYEEKSQQMEIIHVMVNGERKSTRLNNPDEKASFSF